MIDYAHQEDDYSYIRFKSGVTIRVGPWAMGWYAEVSSVKEDYCICVDDIKTRDAAAAQAMVFYLQRVKGEVPRLEELIEGIDE